MKPAYLILTAAFLIGAALVTSQSNAAPPESSSRSKWEYKVIHESEDINHVNATPQETIDSRSSKNLNDLGEQGWELVSVTSTVLKETEARVYFLKRSTSR